jgi:hypothetical protein
MTAHLHVLPESRILCILLLLPRTFSWLGTYECLQFIWNYNSLVISIKKKGCRVEGVTLILDLNNEILRILYLSILLHLLCINFYVSINAAIYFSSVILVPFHNMFLPQSAIIKFYYLPKLLTVLILNVHIHMFFFSIYVSLKLRRCCVHEIF